MAEYQKIARYSYRVLMPGDQQTGKLAIYDPAVDPAILIKAKKVLGIS